MDTEKKQIPDRRKQYIVKKRFQRNFALAFLVLGLIVGTGVVVSYWYFGVKAVKAHLFMTHFMPADPRDVIFPVFFKTTFIFVLLLVPAAAVLTGVIFRQLSLRFMTFSTAMERIGKGDLMVPVPEERHNSLNEKLEAARRKLHHMVTSLHGIQKEISHVSDSAFYHEKDMKELEYLSKSFKNNLSRFKFKKPA
ncbi:MAG TPA: hypothetical protein ENG95_05800 [Nitrospirae bacterium]|nr:hypothetical protein BMS3Abin10_01455 [bacterium BMS3Abin10]GBE39580.1 hypothetical protein BMS3Bbin08_02206 [bacterium BMS3Bbin08]HDH51664.1 hypothetical protein [Nitrospirota bacterium]HDK81862.1 hypothetical protein [Nitrospirota bacterium]HDO26135.1 hypothetical protein [Nitrospirota bacterium]